MQPVIRTEYPQKRATLRCGAARTPCYAIRDTERHAYHPECPHELQGLAGP